MVLAPASDCWSVPTRPDCWPCHMVRAGTMPQSTEHGLTVHEGLNEERKPNAEACAATKLKK